MQGSNHLEESDRRPLDFCPICLHKLQVTIGFNIADRYKVKTLNRKQIVMINPIPSFEFLFTVDSHIQYSAAVVLK